MGGGGNRNRTSLKQKLKLPGPQSQNGPFQSFQHSNLFLSPNETLSQDVKIALKQILGNQKYSIKYLHLD